MKSSNTQLKANGFAYVFIFTVLLVLLIPESKNKSFDVHYQSPNKLS